jgi:membrane-bound serine protease (ClpP class)
MIFLINPNLAHLLVVASIVLILLTDINPKSMKLKIGMALCCVGAGVEFIYLKVNPWALLLVAFSPLPFLITVRQEHAYNPLFLITILMLVIGSVFLFVDQNNRPLVNFGLAGFVSIIYASIIWISTERIRNAEGIRLNNDSDSIVGLIGEARTDIEAHSAGSVLVEGEIWQARSKQPIHAGDTVRILRQDGFWLTVKKVENLTKK